MTTALSTEWTNELIDQAARLWADGCSASQIAAAIGRSRSAVLGKAFRLPERFPARGKERPSETSRRVVEKLRGPAARSERETAPRPPRTPRLPKPVLEAEVLPLGWLREPGQHVRNDLSVFVLDGVTPVAFADLGRNACRFPLQTFDDIGGPDMPCCGARTDDGKSYCGAHRLVMVGRVG